MPRLKVDPKEIHRCAVTLGIGHGHVTELRVLEAKLGDSRSPITFSGYFDDPEALVKSVLKVESAKGFYLVLNPILPDLIARRCNRADRAAQGETTKDHDIAQRHWLPIDLDPVRPAGISSSEEEHEASIQRAREVAAYLTSEGWPAPILGDSGNGAHLLYLIDLPTEDGGLVKRCLAGLDHRFSDASVKVDTSVFNPARIWKLYGTPACKGDSTASRPHRMARLLEVPDQLKVVSSSMLLALASEPEDPENLQPAPEPGRRKEHRPTLGKSDEGFDLEKFMAEHFPDAKGPDPYAEGGRIWVLSDCFFRPGDGQTMFVMQMANGAISAGCQHSTCPGSKSSGNHWQELRSHFEGSTFLGQLPGKAHLDKELSGLPRTEFGLSERFRKRFGDQCRYIEAWGKWLVFNGRRWEMSDCEAELRAQTTIQAIRREAWHLKDKDDDGESKGNEGEGQSKQGAPGVGDGMPAGQQDEQSPEVGE